MLDFLGTHVAWMPFAVQEDEAFDPAQIRFFGAYALVPGTNRRTHLLQEPGGLKLALRHRALLSDATKMPDENTVHVCTITKIERHGQGERSDVRLTQVLRQGMASWERGLPARS